MYVNCQGRSIYYSVEGTGSPVLLLNGIMMSTKSWEQFVPELSAKHKLIRMDFFDQGQSERMEEAYDHSIQVQAALAVMDAVGETSYQICGISYGGQVALQIALAAPERVSRLLISNASGETSAWLREIGHAWNAAATDGLSYYLTTIPSIYSPQFFCREHNWMEERKEKLLTIFSQEAFREAMVRLTNSSEFYDVTQDLGRITQETLIVGCQYDFLTPWYQQQALHSQIRGSRLLFVPDCGHATMYEQPQLFLSLVLGFFAHRQSDFAF